MLTQILHRIVANPWVYDTVQKIAGRDRVFKRIEPHVAQASGKTLLDIGGGTGEFARIVPPSATYIWLDNDPQKLRGMRAKFTAVRAVLCDANQIAMKGKSVDIGACISISHHLTDEQLSGAVREFARVCRSKLIFFDAIRQAASPVSNFLWKYDRGSHPRSVEQLRSEIGKHFHIEFEERFSIYHHYWLCIGTPKNGETSIGKGQVGRS
jgi:ubiquinone/menaquinone biosynthesis C-methylase UbiE